MRKLVLILLAVASLGAQKCNPCATGEVLTDKGCVCKEGHVPDSDGKGCHIPPPPVTTTTTTLPAPPTPEPTIAPPTPSPVIECVLPSKPECGGPEGPAGVYGCCSTHVGGRGDFGYVVDEAQDILEKDYPFLFDGNKVISEEAYTKALAKEIQKKGYCAVSGGPADEVGVKNTNSYSEQFDVVFGNMRVRREGYVARCEPARF